MSITLCLLVWSIKTATSELDVSQEAVCYSVRQLQDELIALKSAMFNEFTLLKQKAKSDKADMLKMKIKFESDIESAKKRQAKMTSGFSSIVADVKKRLSYLENLHKVDGGWSDWTDSGNCSTICGGGIKQRNRTCTNPSPAHGGSECNGKTVETTSCNTVSCPIDGKWSDWTAFTKCSTICGGGIKQRKRTCTNPSPAHGGSDCNGKTVERTSCNTGSCPNYVIKSSHTASCSHGKDLTQSECQNEALIFAKASKHKYAAFFRPGAKIIWQGTFSWTTDNFGCTIYDDGRIYFNSEQSGRNKYYSHIRSICKN